MMSGTSRRALLLVALPLAIAGTASAEEDSQWTVSGNVGLQMRYFTQDPLWPGQDPSKLQFSLSGEAEFRWRSQQGNQRASFIPFARIDDTDDKRTHADLREAYWALEGDTAELLIGANKVFWGVTESVHLVDIINQTDLVEDIDREDKLGQPMVNVAVQRDWGLLDFYVMPYFRERTFPGVEGRFRPPVPVDGDNAVYESGSEQAHTDLVFRYSHYFDEVDLGLYYFKGTSREPRLVLAGDGSRILPHYDLIDQAGLDLQYTREAWLWKLESIVRSGFQDTFGAAVGGFEYTFFGVSESGADVGVLMEYQYDNRSMAEPLTFADNDVFLATRMTLNDAQDTALLAGVTVDTKTSEAFFNVEGERRIGSNMVLSLRVRVLTGSSPPEPSYAVSNDDYVQLQFKGYF
jgi:hypothetical protein